MTLKASDIMSKPVITVNYVTPMHEVMALFQQHEITGVPVVDQGGRTRRCRLHHRRPFRQRGRRRDR
ncbi:MAG: hypothetical protein CME26_11520 [Gemmatimonadetes bacterium]|nr:hypothetical protein [Gemmatimonadota bacterium]